MRIKKITYCIATLFLIAVAFSVYADTTISECNLTLNEATQNYTLTQDVQATNTTCYTILGDDITLDCAGYMINFTGNSSAAGITSPDGNHVLIKNCNLHGLSSGTGDALHFGGNLSVFQNISVEVQNASENAITIGGENVRVINLTIFGGNATHILIEGLNATLVEVTSIGGATGRDFYGVKLTPSDKSTTIRDSSFSGSGRPFISEGNETVIVNSTFSSTNDVALYLDSSGTNVTDSTISTTSATALETAPDDENTRFEGITVTSSGAGMTASANLNAPVTAMHSSFSNPIGTGVLFLMSNNSYFVNTTISTHSGTGVFIGFTGASIHVSENVFINTTILSNKTWFTSSTSSTNNNFSDTKFLTNDGFIRLLSTFTVPDNKNVGIIHINMTSNSAFLNSSAFSFLNVSGQISLNNITSIDPQPLVDLETANTFSACTSICTEESFSNNVFIFNVSHFTTFSSNESAQDIDNDNIIDIEDPLVGNISHVTGIPPTELTAAIDGSSTITGNITGVKEFILRESGNLLLNFTHNFTASAINLSKFTIVHSGQGIVVNLSGQLSTNKTLYVPDTGFTSLCVKDAEVTTISQISASCTGTNEYDFTSCLGNTGPTTISGIDCYDQGSLIRVDNLTHSGIRGSGGASISGASILNEGQSSSFTESTAGSDNAQATNVTEINFSTTASTTKWQGYFGNVEGNLRMGSGSNILYSFGSLPISQIIAVFASTDSNFDFSATTATTAANVDTIWGFTTADADSGTNVFADGSATISDVPAVPIANLTAYTSAGVLSTSLYQSGVVTDGGTISAGEYNSLAFGVNVDANERDFSNSTVIDFELIVPVNGSGQATTQSYFFFMDIS